MSYTIKGKRITTACFIRVKLRLHTVICRAGLAPQDSKNRKKVLHVANHRFSHQRRSPFNNDFHSLPQRQAIKRF